MDKRTVVLVVYGMLQHRNCGYHEEEIEIGRWICVEGKGRLKIILCIHTKAGARVSWKLREHFNWRQSPPGLRIAPSPERRIAPFRACNPPWNEFKVSVRNAVAAARITTCHKKHSMLLH